MSEGSSESAFSAIIPVKDRPLELVNAVEALIRQTLPPSEIIVVDQSQSADCRRGVEALYARGAPGAPPLVYLHAPEIDGLTAARNAGFRRSRCPVVLYCDDDSVLEPECLRLLQDALVKYPELVGVGGIITNYKPPPQRLLAYRRFFYRGPFWDERQPVYWNWSRHGPGTLVRTRKLNGGCMAFRREVLEAVGGFDERYRGSCVGEDMEVSQRLAARGAALALAGGAYLTHGSLGAWKKRSSFFETEITAAHYLLRKNLSATAAQALINRVRFVWMLTGIGLLASASSLRQRSWEPLSSVLAGLRCVASNYRGCPFLKS